MQHEAFTRVRDPGANEGKAGNLSRRSPAGQHARVRGQTPNHVALPRDEALEDERYRAAVLAWEAGDDAAYWEQMGREEALWESLSDALVDEITEEGGEDED
jgi:hypothetical protein